MTVSRWERGSSTPRGSARAAIDRLVGVSGESREPDVSNVKPASAREGFEQAGVAELVRAVGEEAATRALRRLVLLRIAPVSRSVPVDPAERFREVERALREQSELISKGRIG